MYRNLILIIMPILRVLTDALVPPCFSSKIYQKFSNIFCKYILCSKIITSALIIINIICSGISIGCWKIHFSQPLLILVWSMFVYVKQSDEGTFISIRPHPLRILTLTEHFFFQWDVYFESSQFTQQIFLNSSDTTTKALEVDFLCPSCWFEKFCQWMQELFKIKIYKLFGMSWKIISPDCEGCHW